LASLAIPRFSEASAKAKIAEAPRVLASFESAFLAYVAETGKTDATSGDLIFEIPNDSKWFSYTVGANGAATAGAAATIGKFLSGSGLHSVYVPRANVDATNEDCFKHTASSDAVAKKMVPNFYGNKCSGTPD